MTQRALNAIVYALITAGAAITAGGKLPENAVQWIALAGAALTAGWGKYTTNTELVWPPDRQVWTEDQRREAQGLPTKHPA